MDQSIEDTDNKDKSITYTSSNSYLLLRLFTSEYFDSWLAISYIFRYPHITGVQHYLCNELRKFPAEEVEFFLPQLAHLLITRPNESTAVESLLLDMALGSSHVAMLLYWYLQAYLSDQSPNPRTASFKHCQRIFNTVQELLFTDISPELLVDAPEPTQHAFVYAMENSKSVIPPPSRQKSLVSRFRAMLRLAPRVRENAYSAMVGVSAALASPGAPSLSPSMGWMAISQGQSIKVVEGNEVDLDLLNSGQPLATGRVNSRSSSLSRREKKDRPKVLNIPSTYGMASSSPTTPLIQEVGDRLEFDESQDIVDMYRPRARMPPTLPSKIDSSLHLPSEPVLCTSLKNKSLTPPVSRVSTESCQTVAVMEDLGRPRSVMANLNAGSTGKNLTDNRTRKNYLNKAAKEFQRNARELDRRMSRPPEYLNNQNGNRKQKTARDNNNNSVSEDRAASMRDTLEDIHAYVEEERPALERRTGYFGAEIKFMTSLMDISQRVCAVPKVGRQQTLKMELTMLNHSLSKNICIPLWCPNRGGSSHHRIVRIPTEDTVVLNSAERAPYLLTLEVLEPDGSSNDNAGDAVSPPTRRSEATTYKGAIQPDRESELVVAGTDPIGDQNFEPEMPVSPGTKLEPGQDVDDQLMSEVFGDLDDVDNIPDMPFTPGATNRRRSGVYGRSAVEADDITRVPAEEPKYASEAGSIKSKQQDPQLSAALKPPRGINTRANQSKSTGSNPHTPSSAPSITQEEINARLHTASVLLAQLARQQKALGINVVNLVPQRRDASPDNNVADSEGGTVSKRRGRQGNAASSAQVMENIRDKLVQEMIQLEKYRLQFPGLDSAPHSANGNVNIDGIGVEDDIDRRAVEFKDDPSAKVLKEDWEAKKARIRRTSPWGRAKNWNLLSVIVKEGADLRQEQFALQLIREMQRIWQREQVDVFVQYYRIMVTGEGCGLIETITNTVSVHSIKKEFYSRNAGYSGPPYTLYSYFVTTYGTPDTEAFREAQNNFMRSLVSYSLITYVLQIRDRHNGNILIDTDGHAIHIDFGFMLSNSPGSVGFEQAPFKFPIEYVEILGGRDSTKFTEFRDLLVRAFLSLRKHAENVCLLVEMMLHSSPLPCLGGGASTVTALRDRFHLALSEQEAKELVDEMLISSCDNITTRMYDTFQYYSNGIL